MDYSTVLLERHTEAATGFVFSKQKDCPREVLINLKLKILLKEHMQNLKNIPNNVQNERRSLTRFMESVLYWRVKTLGFIN